MVYHRVSAEYVSNLTTPGHIYFIQAEGGGPIKIGWATCPKTRMARMQAHCPVQLTILHSEPGNGRQEKALHAQFATHRRHGEWFDPAPELLAEIEARRGRNEPIVYVPAEAPAGQIIPDPRNYMPKQLKDFPLPRS